MIPHEKELVAKFKDQPFALLGINADKSRDALDAWQSKKGVTWRSAFDGGSDGPIANLWNVKGWPTIVVLDKKGVVRFVNLRGKAIDEAVEKLLAEDS